MTRAYLGLGANLGDRLQNLRSAVEELERLDIHVLRSSRVYETEPVGGPPQPDYLNAVLEVETKLDPRELLARCIEAEGELGRVRAERWGPRTIDIDLLSYDALHMDEPGLTLPHPRMHERAFALVPLLELDPDPQLPGGRAASSLPVPADAVRVHAPPLVG